MNTQYAIETLCNAGRYLLETRNLNGKLHVSELDQIKDRADADALKIISIALCVVNGANPTWLKGL